MTVAIALAVTASAQTPISRVADDGLVIDRVAEASKKDLPTDLLKRIVNEDIELLRGKRPDGSYDYAKYERFESGRVVKSFSINDRKDRMETVENRGAWIYRIVVEVPTRRMLVRKNRRRFGSRGFHAIAIAIFRGEGVAPAGRGASIRPDGHRQTGYGESDRHGAGRWRLRER